MHGTNCFRPNLRATIRQLITIHTGDHHVFQFHESQTLGNPPWFITINSVWASGLHITEATRPRACITQDHDGCGTAAPTFTHVWAACLLANSMQPVLTNYSLEPFVTSATRNTGAQPIWLTANDALLWRAVVVQHHARQTHQCWTHIARGISTKRARVSR